MQKIISLSAILATLVTPAFADITGSSNCTEGVLGTSANGSTANIEADWDPNTININWYNGDTQVAQTSCEYDDTIVLPTQPTKQGYTFAGWTLRPAPTRTEVNICSNINNQQDCNNSYVLYDDCNGGLTDVNCKWVGAYCTEEEHITCSGGSN